MNAMTISSVATTMARRLTWRWLLMLVACCLPLSWVQAGQLQSFERNSLEQIIQSQQGHAFWLVLWDLDCVYCVKSMRHLGQWQKEHADLHVVTVATDSLDQEPALQQRLLEVGLANYPAYAFGDESSQALRYAIDPKWRGEKPRAYFYDAKGTRQTFTGVLDLSKLP